MAESCGAERSGCDDGAARSGAAWRRMRSCDGGFEVGEEERSEHGRDVEA